jgi:hypothetical protein
MTAPGETGGQPLLAEEALGEIRDDLIEAVNTIDRSLRAIAVASLTIKQALRDIAALSRP